MTTTISPAMAASTEVLGSTNLVTSFTNDFENTEYYTPSVSKGNYYRTSTATTTLPYINNGGS